MYLRSTFALVSAPLHSLWLRGLERSGRSFTTSLEILREFVLEKGKDLKELRLEVGRDRLERVAEGARLLEALDAKGIALLLVK